MQYLCKILSLSYQNDLTSSSFNLRCCQWRPFTRRKAQLGGPGWQRTPVQDWCHGRPSSRSDQNQPVPVSTGQCDLGAGGRTLQAHPIPRLQAYSPPSGLFRWQYVHPHGGLPLPRRQQLWGEPEHAALRQPCKEHPEPSTRQRGPQGCTTAPVPGGDQRAEGAHLRAARDWMPQL